MKRPGLLPGLFIYCLVVAEALLNHVYFGPNHGIVA
jgi:hypothetical protein